MPFQLPPVFLRDRTVRRLLACALPLNAYAVWSALAGASSWLPAAVCVVVSVAVLAELWPRGPQDAPVQVDDSGLRREDGVSREHILWQDVQEIRMLSAADTPTLQDAYLALVAPDGKGCLIPERDVLRSQLLDELGTRFPGLDPTLARSALGAEGEHDILLWKRQPACTD